MRLEMLITILTLVVAINLSAWSAPSADGSPTSVFKKKPEQSKERSDVETTLQESLHVSPTPNQNFSHMKPMKPRDWSRLHSLGIGYGSGVFDVEKRNNTLLFLNYLFSHYYEEGVADEYGVDMSQASLLGLSFGKKFLSSGYSDWYEPYWKLGMGLYLYSGDYLAGVINYRRYVIRASLGIDDFLNAKRQFKWDIGIGYGMLGYSLTTQITVAIPAL